MGRRLALLADTAHEAPWSRASGSETVALVRGLGEGDRVWIEVELIPEGFQKLSLVEGSNPLLTFNPLSWARYRVCKQANGHCEMTSVEVFFG